MYIPSDGNSSGHWSNPESNLDSTSTELVIIKSLLNGMVISYEPQDNLLIRYKVEKGSYFRRNRVAVASRCRAASLSRRCTVVCGEFFAATLDTSINPRGSFFQMKTLPRRRCGTLMSPSSRCLPAGRTPVSTEVAVSKITAKTYANVSRHSPVRERYSFSSRFRS